MTVVTWTYTICPQPKVKLEKKGFSFLNYNCKYLDSTDFFFFFGQDIARGLASLCQIILGTMLAGFTVMGTVLATTTGQMSIVQFFCDHLLVVSFSTCPKGKRLLLRSGLVNLCLHCSTTSLWDTGLKINHYPIAENVYENVFSFSLKKKLLTLLQFLPWVSHGSCCDVWHLTLTPPPLAALNFVILHHGLHHFFPSMSNHRILYRLGD